MDATAADAALKEFVERLPDYRTVADQLQEQITDVLKQQQVQILAVTTRVKDPASLRDKLIRPDKSYTSLDDVTDLIGARVIAYFSSDVDRIAGLIGSTVIRIDESRSPDKRNLVDPHHFGYASRHLVGAFHLHTP